MPNNYIDSIRLSGTTYQIQGSGGGGTVDPSLDPTSTNPVENKAIYNKFDEVEQVTEAGLNALNDKITPTVELTQAQYDALTTKDPNTYYIITDAQAGDLTNYYTKTETNTLLGGKADTATTYTKTETNTLLGGKADTATTYTKTEVDTAIDDKQDTLVSGTNIKTINNESILGSGNIDIQGGGKAIEAGTNISVTTGETADTINCTLPLTVGNSNSSLSLGDGNSLNNSSRGFAIGDSNSIGNLSANSLVGGMRSSISYNCANSFAFGYQANAGAKNSFSMGADTKTSNHFEAAIGRYNVSNTGSTDADKTRFSVGNGTSDNARHNAFEIRQNGDIYLSLNGQDVKLQDQLGGYVTKNTEQTISGRKIFTYSASSGKAIEFKQTSDSAKVGFSIKNSAAINNELASFELRPNTFTIDNVQHPLLYFGHYRSTNTANAGVPQTVIGFRQYDQKNAAAYHYLIPLPEKAKTPFSLTTSFKDYYAPMGFKNGSTMITADDTGVVDLSSELGGLKLKKLTQAEYDALATKDSNVLYVIVG